MRRAVCRCFLGALRSSLRIWWTTGRSGSRIEGRRGRVRRYPGSSEWVRIFLRVFQWMPYSRQAARRLRPSTRTRRRISAHFSMFVYTPVPHSPCPRWLANGPPSWSRGGESDQGRCTFRPPVGYPARRCTFPPPFTVVGYRTNDGHAVIALAFHENARIRVALVDQVLTRQQITLRQRFMDHLDHVVVRCRRGGGLDVDDQVRQLLFTGLGQVLFVTHPIHIALGAVARLRVVR